MLTRLFPALVMFGIIACTPHAARSIQQDDRSAANADAPAPMRVLVFSKTAGFRHDSIPAGVEAMKQLGTAHGFFVDATEDANRFADDSLARYSVVIFLNTTGDVLSDAQQEAFERYINAGGGFVGIHSATDTEHDWPWYGKLVGARFRSHPAIQKAVVEVVDRAHPSTTHLPERWERTDEWYDFDAHPRTRIGDRLRLLAVLDEATYAGGQMGQEHPFAWCHEFSGGRAWYTAGGHTIESFSEPAFLQHVLGGIQWAAGIDPGSASPKVQHLKSK